MTDKNNVIIIDENAEDEATELSQEELEEMQRNERLQKIFKKRKKRNTTIWSNLSIITNVMGLFGIMVGMLLENGMIAAVCLAVILISSIVNYIFLR